MSENNTSTRRPQPAIFGCAGTRLNVLERNLFRDSNPLGFILFKRNCESADQIRYLIMELQQTVGRKDIAIAIDQEGGRVARLRPPNWPKYPPARAFGLMYEREPDWGLEAIKLFTRVMAHELVSLGITINCAPVIDLYDPDGTPALGDRAFSSDPAIVVTLARAQAETYLANGILPVIKHLPGHGRLTVDPHHVLPQITASLAELQASDFIPFQALKDMPLAMNSHAVFQALDAENPASLSHMINTTIARTALGFDGVILSDDLTMKALRGNPGDLARRALAAGNDIVLHCSGDSSEMQSIALALNPMSDASWARWTHANAMARPINSAYNPADDAARLDVLLGGLAYEDFG